ncbi:MAG: 30S ribosomal protein S2 [Nanoarchaeota archaeon]
MAENKLLVALDEYLKAGIHIGTKFRTKDTKHFVYKIRDDGLSVLNVQDIDRRIGIASKFLSQYKPEDILIICRRENGWHAANLMGKLTGIRVVTGKYPAGIMTNVELDNFMEARLILVVDPGPDKNAVIDSYKNSVPVIALCDTNNDAKYVDLVVPCNNKGRNSLGLIFWILTKSYLVNRKLIKSDKEFKYKIEDFVVE